MRASAHCERQEYFIEQRSVTSEEPSNSLAGT